MKCAGRNFAEEDVKNKNFSNLRRSNFNVEISGDNRDGWWTGEHRAGGLGSEIQLSQSVIRGITQTLNTLDLFKIFKIL